MKIFSIGYALVIWLTCKSFNLADGSDISLSIGVSNVDVLFSSSFLAVDSSTFNRLAAASATEILRQWYKTFFAGTNSDAK